MPRLRRRGTGGQRSVIYRDDAEIQFGGVAMVEWSADDANAACLFIDLPAGGAIDVPVLLLGLTDADFGYFAGITQPTLALEDADGDSYVSLSFSANDTPYLTVGGGASSFGITAATTNIAASTLATIYGAGTQIGFDSGAYMKFAVADTTGAVTITHAGDSKAIGWTSTGGLTFTGAFEVVGATTLDALTTAGNLSVDATTALIDGSTSVRNVSAGFVSSEAPDIRFGFSDSIYTKFAVANTTGNLTITHVGGSTDLVTWTAAGGFSLVGNVAVTGTFGASGTLSVGLDATAGTLELYPATTNSGTTTLTMADNTGDTITNITVAAQAGARTYTLPDAGASANFVFMTASQAVAGTLTRTDLTEEALAVYGVPLALVRQEDGIPLAVAETADTFNLIVSGNIWYLKGEISQGETETSESCFQFVLPPEYVAAGDVKVRIKNRCVLGSGTNNGSTLDVEVFEQTGNGAIGSDLVSTSAQTYAATSAWQTTDFVVDGSGLVAGDILNVVVTAVVIESGASNPIHVELDGLAMLLDIKG